ncbi:MAG: TIGR01212 family radical SAM protein [Spirochaetales bacterium]|nr:TIGR01212 family radical SAM protein [Spirochaetales bacterium]
MTKPVSEDRPWRFRRYSHYLKEKYGCSAYRVGIDCGFSCPNRGPSREHHGCTYCETYGAAAIYQDSLLSIREQVDRGIAFLTRRYGARVFLLYLQAFSNTHDTPENLRRIYDYALSLGDFRELIVSTRPDCIDEEKADLLAGYIKDGMDVWVELGLQSAHNRTLEAVHRGHTVEDFDRAYHMLRLRGLKLSVHLILGLPGEGWPEIEHTLRYVASLDPDGIKLHNLHIPFGTIMYEQYEQGEIDTVPFETYLDYVVGALELLPSRTVIQRVVADTPRERLAAPKDFGNKCVFIEVLERKMIELGTFQGCKFQSM